MNYINNFFIRNNSSIKLASNKMSKFGLRCLVVLDVKNRYLGTLSTGDIRKSLIKGSKVQDKIKKIYQKKSFFIKYKKNKNYNYKKILLKKKLDLIPILDKNYRVINVISQDIFIDKKKKINKKKQNYSVLIMAGGKGTRLAPFTHVLPKPLIPINKKTLLEHILDELKKNGVNKISFAVNYKSKTLIAYLDEIKKKKFKINFFKEHKPLGTIGILSKIYKKFEKNILIANCDTIIKYDYSKIFEYHKKNNYGITIVLAKKKQKLSYGSCELSKNNKELLSIKEKPNISYVANTGFFFIKKEFAKLIPKNNYFDATSLFEKCLKKGEKIGTYTLNEKNWLDVGQWKEYLHASEKLRIR
tara:strand:+ start:8449 stop:9522 length:1074 start_codon:yes stop_codon:yes gene_type:complete